MPLNTVRGRQRWKDLYEFEAIQVYRARSRTARAVTQKNPFLEKKERMNERKEEGKKRKKEIPSMHFKGHGL